ncbi:MAG: coenzyme F420-0:L-glutamate ligase [Candidatus Lokiarchaeota archaeon]|nr:coenzyme F420-0:L-glutamate ligase [Candidatus Lokiarchaeota archaeon]
MQLFSLKLPLIKKNDPLLEIIANQLVSEKKPLKNGDVMVISEKVVATSQGRVVSLSEVGPISEKAKKLAKKYDMDDRFVELILREATTILGGMTHVILAEVNDFLIANAGIDQSNAGPDNVVLLPSNVKQVAWDYWNEFKARFNLENLGIIIADSRVQPLRVGTIGIAIATAGFEPIQDCIGQSDLYDRPLEITKRAVADDLASAAQFLLGEAGEQTPVVIIQDIKLNFTDSPQTITRMPPEECLYMNIFARYLEKRNK